jgi:transcriptional regulator with XRE-family HTH domain
MAVGLADLRRDRGLSQCDLEMASGITVREIRRIEGRKVVPHFSTRYVLASALGVRMTDIAW